MISIPALRVPALRDNAQRSGGWHAGTSAFRRSLLDCAFRRSLRALSAIGAIPALARLCCSVLLQLFEDSDTRAPGNAPCSKSPQASATGSTTRSSWTCCATAPTSPHAVKRGASANPALTARTALRRAHSAQRGRGSRDPRPLRASRVMRSPTPPSAAPWLRCVSLRCVHHVCVCVCVRARASVFVYV